MNNDKAHEIATIAVSEVAGDSPLLTSDQVAQVLGIKTDSFYTLFSRGVYSAIPNLRAGRKRMFHREGFIEFLARSQPS